MGRTHCKECQRIGDSKVDVDGDWTDGYTCGGCVENDPLHGILADHYWANGGMNEYECARDVLAFFKLEATSEALDAVARKVRRTDDFREMAEGVKSVVAKCRTVSEAMPESVRGL